MLTGDELFMEIRDAFGIDVMSQKEQIRLQRMVDTLLPNNEIHYGQDLHSYTILRRRIRCF